MSSRPLPNILITGTPGVGKTVHGTQLTTENPLLRHLSVNDVVRDHQCHEGWDAERNCWIVDEDKLLDVLEEMEVKEKGGWVLDWHGADVFPKSWIDLVVVLRCEDTGVMWERLRTRNYDDAKIQENLDAEIFGILAEEAREGFDEEIVVELNSQSAEDIDSNCERISQWLESWKKQHAED